MTLAEQLYQEVREKMNWKFEEELDNDMKKSLETYSQVDSTEEKNVTNWLLWNADQQLKDLARRKANGEDVNGLIAEFRDHSKIRFYY